MRIFVNILPVIKLTSRTCSNVSSRRYTSLVKVTSQKYQVENLLFRNSTGRCFCFNKKGNTEFTCSHDSYRVLFVLFNYHNVYECCMRNTIRSIFLKPMSVQINELTNQLNSKDSFTDKEQTFNSVVKYQPADVEYLKFFEDYLNIVKHYWNIKDVKLCVATANDKKVFDVTDFLNRSNLMKIDAYKPLLKGALWHKTMPFSVSKGHSGPIPMVFAKKSFSTNTTVGVEKSFSEHKASPKCDPNYNFPHLSKIFGTENLLMRSDAYNQSLLEAAKRRAALDECAVDAKKFKNFVIERPKVVHIKGCSAPKLNNEYLLKSEFDSSSKPCPPPLRPKKQAASSGCKKADASKPPESPDLCKDELEKFERNKEKEMQKKRSKMPTGCEDPKCNKNDRCNKIQKNPHKTASNQQSSDKYQCLTEPPIIIEHINNHSSKGTSYKLPGCQKPSMKENDLYQVQMKENEKKDIGNPSKSDSTGKVKSEKQKNPCLEKENEYKPKCNEDPCKVDTPSGNATKTTPAKSKDSDIGSPSKSDSSGKVKSEKQKNPCLEKEKEYKPKCNEDPLKEDKPSGNAAKTTAGKSKDSDNKKYPCGGRKRKHGLNKRYKKGNPCKRKKSYGAIRQKHDPCKRDPSMKKNPCAGNKQTENSSKEQKQIEDPCKTREPSGASKKKEDPYKDQKQKEDPCKRREPSGGSKEKEDPCKKQKLTEDPCKKREPSGESKKKEDFYKDQKQKEDPCKKGEPSGGSKEKEDPFKKQKLKEDPCKKREPSGEIKKEDFYKDQKQKEDPCKRREPSGGSKEKEDPCKKQKLKEDPCTKRESCGENNKEDPCKEPKQKEDPCKKREPSGESKKNEDACKEQKQGENAVKKREPSGLSKEKDHCKEQKQKDDPCKKEKEDPCLKKKSSPCVNAPKKENASANPCTTKMGQKTFSSSSSKKSKRETRPNCGDSKNKKETMPNCGQTKNKRETRPNCGQAKKYYSTLATAWPRQSSNSMIKRTLTNLPSIRYNKQFHNFAYKRYFSSKRKDKNNKTLDELGRESQCKAVESPTPAQRKPAYNPHPREGLRQCYPTYDMDCKKFCKDSRKTDCKQFKFLKDTDNKKRTNKK